MCIDIEDPSNQPNTRGNHTGTRGYRSPSLLTTGRCEYHDDLWVAAVIIVEMALGIRLYTRALERHAQIQANRYQSKTKAKSPSEAVQRAREENANNVANAVLAGTYIPWNELIGIYPTALVYFLQRVTRDKSPHFTNVTEVLSFLHHRGNAAAFERRRSQQRVPHVQPPTSVSVLVDV